MGFSHYDGYYRRFLAVYRKIAALMTALLRKDEFLWGEKATMAFEELKTAMTATHVLALLDFSKQFVIECDALRAIIECGADVGWKISGLLEQSII